MCRTDGIGFSGPVRNLSAPHRTVREKQAECVLDRVVQGALKPDVYGFRSRLVRPSIRLYSYISLSLLGLDATDTQYVDVFGCLKTMSNFVFLKMLAGKKAQRSRTHMPVYS